MNITTLLKAISNSTVGNRILTRYTKVGPFTYSTMYQQKKTKKGLQSNYSKIKPYINNRGMYVFTDMSNDIIYIGEASQQTIYKRITNHFTNIKGSLLKKVDISVLGNSQFYLFIDKTTTTVVRDILLDEVLLIGISRPIHNF